MKRSERCLESKELLLLPYLRLIEMAIGVLVEALLPGGGGAAASGGPPTKDESGLKEWIRSKLKALASLLRKLAWKLLKLGLVSLGVL